MTALVEIVARHHLADEGHKEHEEAVGQPLALDLQERNGCDPGSQEKGDYSGDGEL